jgi:two-component SAPR family response regulator
VNAKAEELLKTLAAHSNLDFTSSVVCELIVEMEAPKLQAVLRMAEHQVKVINSRLGEGEVLSSNKVGHFLGLSKALSQQMSNPNADVRKTVVFCLVEICQAIGIETFQSEVVEGLLNAS